MFLQQAQCVFLVMVVNFDQFQFNFYGVTYSYSSPRSYALLLTNILFAEFEVASQMFDLSKRLSLKSQFVCPVSQRATVPKCVSKL